MTVEKIGQYHTTVLQCKNDIDALHKKYENDAKQLEIEAKQKLHQLIMDTEK